MSRTARVRAVLSVAALVVSGAAALVVAPPAQAAFVAPRALPSTIAASAYHTLAVTPGGNVRAWGDNASGQLGDGTVTERRAAVTVRAPSGTGPLSGVVQVAAGNYDSYALRSDGTVWAWGDNAEGELGDRSVTSRSRPVAVRLGDGRPLGGIVAIAAGRAHGLALAADGTVWSWGANQAGQLGKHSASAYWTFASHVTDSDGHPLTHVVQVVAGSENSYAVLADGTVRAWGEGASGQLGGGILSDADEPVTVYARNGGAPVGLDGIVALAAGAFHVLALSKDGKVWAWGENSDGQLGLGNTTNQDYATQVPINFTITALYSGPLSTASFARDSLGSVRAWGRVGASLGNGSADRSWTSPRYLQDLSTGRTLRTIALGRASGVASYTTGSARGWGSNEFGHLGDGSLVSALVGPIASSTVGTVGPPSLFVRSGPRLSAAPAVGRKISVSRGTWGLPATAWAYQWLRDGRAIRGATRPSYRVTSADRGHTIRARVAAARYGYSPGAAITGIPVPVRRPSPVPGRFAAGATRPSLVATSFHSLAVTPSGHVRAWGLDDEGQLGLNGATGQQPSARTVYAPFGHMGYLERVVAVTATAYSSCGLEAAGTVRCWGRGAEGQLGNGQVAPSTLPVAVTVDGTRPLSGIVAISGGLNHVVALRSDGTVWTWGSDSHGQLGEGGGGGQASVAGPVPGPGGSGSLTGVVAVAAGGDSTYALRRDGSVLAWGDNSSGQLGDGTTNFHNVPNYVLGPNGVVHLAGVVAVTSAQQHALALTRSGVLYSWGVNGNGQLGVGDHSGRTLPTLVTALPQVSAVYAGPYSRQSFAIGRDGALFAWGEGSNYGLGDGGNVDRVSPVRVAVPIGTRVLAVTSGVYSATALAAGGGVLTWGSNTLGALGNGGTPTASAVPATASTVGTAGPPALYRLRAPVIGGVTRVGRVLSVSRGSWGLPATAWAYQWYRDGHAIRGATRAAYKVTTTDRGHRLTARVVATRYGYPAGAAVAAARAVPR